MSGQSDDLPSTLTVGPDGAISLPERVLRALGVAPGDSVQIYRSEGALVVTTADAFLRRLQERYEAVPKGVSMVDELIAERRLEAARERAESAGG